MNFMAWLEVALRWIHVFAGIMWVGATYYFTWLDGRFEELEKEGPKAPGEKKFVWMVHSGGFYAVEKQKVPQVMPGTLHWFKWEAGITWISGILLFGLVFYHGGLLIEADEWPISKATANWLSLGLIIAGWVVYDLMCKFLRNETAVVAIGFGLIVLLAFIFTGHADVNLFGKQITWKPIFGIRGACLQLGTMFGTIMAANVWMRILPAQRRMVAALKAGQQPDMTEGARAKARSKHNTFIVVPVVFLMLSYHFVSIFREQYNWIILSSVVLIGWGAAKLIRKA